MVQFPSLKSKVEIESNEVVERNGERVGDRELEMEKKDEKAEIEEITKEQPTETPVEPAVVVQVVQPVALTAEDSTTAQIETILEEDLTDLYLTMPRETQQKFKVKGEETSSKIRQLVQKTKINAKKIFQLIRDWLKIIPGVNRFFLEQEAKIKTDKILRL